MPFTVACCPLVGLVGKLMFGLVDIYHLVTKGAVGAVKLAVYLAYPLVILISSRYPFSVSVVYGVPAEK
jgi:hypothetical protein